MTTVKQYKRYNPIDLLGSNVRVKILELLALNKEMTITKIVKTIHSNNSIVNKHLGFLKEIGFLQEKKFGKIKIFRYKEENPEAFSFKTFIELFKKNKLSIGQIFSSQSKAKIIIYLAKKEEANFSMIRKKSGQRAKGIKRHLNFLKKLGIIEIKTFGIIKIYRYRKEEIIPRAIKKLVEFLEDATK